jgi:hypothetical protein
MSSAEEKFTAFFLKLSAASSVGSPTVFRLYIAS